MSFFPLWKICFSPEEMKGRVKVCYCCPGSWGRLSRVRCAGRSSLITPSARSDLSRCRHMPTQPACWPQARTSGMSKTLHFESRVPYYRPDRTDYFGGSCILRRDRQLWAIWLMADPSIPSLRINIGQIKISLWQILCAGVGMSGAGFVGGIFPGLFIGF